MPLDGRMSAAELPTGGERTSCYTISILDRPDDSLGGWKAAAFSERRAVAALVAALVAAILLPLWSNDSYFFRDDFKNQYLPGYAEAVRAWQAGEPALLSPLSWRSGALAGEYQYAVFSPVLAGCNLILFGSGVPPHMIAAILAGIHFLILGLGCYVLARSKGLIPPLAVMVGLASTLNGWVFYWGVNWFPALSSFAYIPWIWWLLKRSLEPGADGIKQRGGRWETIAAGLLIAAVVTSGWPFTCLMVGLIAAFLGFRCLYAEKSLRRLAPLAISGAIGLGLSAPAWLMLVEYSGSTIRGQTTDPLALQDEFVVPLKAYFGTILPSLRAAWVGPWMPPHDTDSKLMHVGLAPVALLIAAAITLRGGLVRKLKWDLLGLLILVNLASLPSIGLFKWSFRWLPLLFLQLALFAGQAAMLAAQKSPTRFRPGIAALLAVAAVAGYALAIDNNFSGANIRLSAHLLILALGWAVAEQFRVFSRWRRHLPWMMVCVTSGVTYAILLEGYQPKRKPLGIGLTPVLEPTITYLALYDLEKHRKPGQIVTFAGQRYFPGNEHMHSGLQIVNGYSPMGPAGSNWRFGFDYMGALPSHNTPGDSMPLDAVLRRMAVDGLVVWSGMKTARNISFDDFEPVATLPDARVFHRRGGRTPKVQTLPQALLTAPVDKVWQLPRSRWPLLEKPGLTAADSLPAGGARTETSGSEVSEFGEAELKMVENSRHRVMVAVDASASDRPVVLSFARPWFPGYRAYLDGVPIVVARLDGLMPAVEVPAGRRARVLLHYRPRSLVVGLSISGLTAILLASFVAHRFFRVRHRQWLEPSL